MSSSSSDSNSLLRRLAGPSAGKAGLDSNQERINHIIHDASKGGRFFNNEVKRDEHTTAKVAAIQNVLKQRLENANQSSILHSVHSTLKNMDAERDLSQFIMHCDMDMFYAAVEVLDNPDLHGKPFGVGKGILTTASYEARKYGIRSAMPCFIARKLCDHFIEVPMRMERYVDKSRQVMDIFARFDENMAAASLDEAYLNVTAYMNEHALTPQEVSQRLRSAVHAETGLTVSTGVAPNKTLAKICSDKNKPNGEYTMQFSLDAVRAFMKDLPIRKVPGIGRINERLLQSLGINACGDIAEHLVEIHLLRKELQSEGLLRAYLGIFSNVVAPAKQEDRKSVGTEKTFQPLSDSIALLEKLHMLCHELEADLRRTQFKGRTVTLKYKKHTFENFTRAMSVERFVCTSEDIWPVARGLLERELPLTLRLLGVRLTNLQFVGSARGEITQFFTKQQQESSKNHTPNDTDSDVEIIEKPVLGKEKEIEAASGASKDKHTSDTLKTQQKPFFNDLDESGNTTASDASKDKHTSDTLKTQQKPFFDDLDESDSDVDVFIPKPKRKETEKECTGTSNAPDAPDILKCPVCAKKFNITGDPKMSNDTINKHLDDCLTQQEIALIGSNHTSPTKNSYKKIKRDPFGIYKKA
ncbi:hypothetical protein E3P81_01166 [Wallemia ichthyophaga]|nr:hypothetical protein E3P97_01167 [Wallemia ichthyophaga]TIB05634.1 hypothetical protein E3P96_01053 [Wallemia ichthyophaga]TIB34460.1 hypothetical protein E3P85_00916 [Wallemia ichthyophaga]TIB48724.1 hypothetical protein E3P82_01165 [Wallemia ichthyophaga]TIB52729.1 hypothetical protein E3P81_01166 [Wallemia ichthyophaga]